MKVIKKTLWKRCLSTPTKPPAKNSNICLSETAYQYKGTTKKCKKTNQAAIIQWERQCLMYKPHRKPWPKSKTSDISKLSPSPLHHTFLLGRARFTAQPLSALGARLKFGSGAVFLTARDVSAVKSHSTILQRLCRQISLDYYTIPPATQATIGCPLYSLIKHSLPDLS